MTRRAVAALAAGIAIAWCNIAMAEPIRVATFNTGLDRKGPGLLLRDLERGDAPDVARVVRTVTRNAPDILVLQNVDWDLDGLALNALADRIAAAGHPMPHRFAARPNAGMATGHDMDGDGRRGRARDAQGYGRFAGQGAMAVLSRFPIDAAATRDFTDFPWADLPGAIPPLNDDGTPFPDAERFALQRLSSVAHWDVAVDLPGQRRIHILTWHATPPVFDGPEDRNGRRNHDETAFWLRYLDGDLPFAPPEAPFILMGDANLDPVDGEGRRAALEALLTHPRLQDARPDSPGGVAAAKAQGGVNLRHSGDPAHDTADWRDAPGDPGNRRVDYILPSTDWRILGAGVDWPLSDVTAVTEATRHHLVWIDLEPIYPAARAY
ncbi:endonuclease/exonuclease/phosphatase family protein [Oceaniglobus indicus]|uniref:endonuclease/exonuclease/phosphatase family protein n=1 Tax=Oceaniglobus indicus TaxID=2047749 RepID=UPI001F4E17C3|nr:endonuclease/exonuclease/phosphatase family protein [Oceaniglobus indicus]